MLGKGRLLKTTTISLLSVVSKVFEKLVDNRIVNHLEKYGLFLFCSGVLGVLLQQQIFWQLCLCDRIARGSNRSGLLEL